MSILRRLKKMKLKTFEEWFRIHVEELFGKIETSDKVTEDKTWKRNLKL